MLVLDESGTGGAGGAPDFGGLPAPRRRTTGLLTICANPACASGWLRLWRGRHAPIFEGGWMCGPECAKALVRAAVLREVRGLNGGQDGGQQGQSGLEPAHRHRMPLGLLLLSQGTITREQLRAALARQREAGGRLGMWLEREHGVPERAITRALGIQWGCPVLTLEHHSPERVAGFAPRLLVDAFGFLPLRMAGSSLLYVGFEDRVDRCVSLAIERMTGLRVEAGVVGGREFAAAHRNMLAAAFPPARMVEAAGVDALAAALTRILEAARPVEARLVRMHEYLWLRMWRRFEGEATRAASFAGYPAGPVEDVLGYVADSRASLV